MPHLIFVHGAGVRDAAWWWSKMTEPLAEHGIASSRAATELWRGGEALVIYTTTLPPAARRSGQSTVGCLCGTHMAA